MVVALAGGNEMAHNPSISIGLPCDFSAPRKKPSCVNALIYPLPKLPTKITFRFFRSIPFAMSLLFQSSSTSLKNEAGARAMPHGAFKAPLEANLDTNSPVGLNMSTYPNPSPASSSPSSPTFAYITYNQLPILCMLKGAYPSGICGSTNDQFSTPKVLFHTTILLALKSAAYK